MMLLNGVPFVPPGLPALQSEIERGGERHLARNADKPKQEIGKGLEQQPAFGNSREYPRPLNVFELASGADSVFAVGPGNLVGPLKLIAQVEIRLGGSAGVKLAENRDGSQKIDLRGHRRDAHLRARELLFGP